MKQKLPFILIFAVLPFLIYMSVEEEHHESNSMAFIAKVVNFLILFGGLTYLLRKPIKQFLANRTSRIDTTINDAEESRFGAEEDLNKTEIQLTELSREIEDLREQAVLEGARERERIIRAAREEGERMKKNAQNEIELISKAGIRGLKEYAVILAAAEAMNRIQEQLTPEKHARLIDDSIERLEDLYETSRSR
jgi:F-type H+-transporting ATPase subunit b